MDWVDYYDPESNPMKLQFGVAPTPESDQPNEDATVAVPTVTTFGGRKDYESGQDNGQFAFGGKSYDPRTGYENPEPYAALDPSWFKEYGGFLEPGQLLPIHPAGDPSRTAYVIARDIGPSRRLQAQGKLLDVAPNVKDYLGMGDNDSAVIDFSPVISGQLPKVPIGANLTQDEIQNYINSQDPSSRIAGTPTAGSMQQARGGGIPKVVSTDPDTGLVTYSDGTKVNKATQTVYQPIPGTTQVSVWSPGMKQPHYINAAPKIYRDPGTQLGFIIAPTPEHPDASPEHPYPMNLPGNPASVDTEGVKEGDWSTVPDSIRPIAQAIDQYKYPKISAFALRSPYFQSMLKVVQAVDPKFNYMEYEKRQKLMTDIAGEGKLGQNILSFNTAMDHLGRAVNASEEMKALDLNTGTKPGNYLWQKYYTNTGAPKESAVIAKYNTAEQALENELERATSGSSPHEKGKEGWSDLLASNVPYAAQKSALREAANIIGDRLAEVDEQYRRTFGSDADFSLLSPQAESTLRAIGADDLVQKYGSRGGKRQYLDPNTVSSQPQPFPGSTPSPNETGHLKRRYSPSTGLWQVQNADGTWRISEDGR
jgi:hypothetical protein